MAASRMKNVNFPPGSRAIPQDKGATLTPVTRFAASGSVDLDRLFIVRPIRYVNKANEIDRAGGKGEASCVSIMSSFLGT
jgi:hypothetical protein